MDINLQNPAHYDRLLKEKAHKIRTKFEVFKIPTIEVFASSKENYRMRCEFRVWHDGDDLYFYMFDKVKDEKVRTDQFLPASKLINAVMIDLISEIKHIPSMRQKLFQVDFLSTMSGEILVSLLYHRQLELDWSSTANSILNNLSKKYNINLIGRARNQKIILHQDYVIEKFNFNGKQLIYKQHENSFTQPNGEVAIKMLQWAYDNTKNSSDDLLELYCGNGNFSIALSENFSKVLGTEISKTSVLAAQFNISENKINNLKIVKISAEDLSDALTGLREFKGLGEINLKSYHCKTVLVDPPRAGLDNNTLSMISSFDRIIYISCNAETLFSNIEILSATHDVTHFAIFDQFPYTDHIECGVILDKKTLLVSV